MSDLNQLLCMGCMAPIDDQDTPCPLCGWRRDTLVDPQYLSPGTVLDGRYLVGRVYSHSAESALYIGLDQEEDTKVWVREFVPCGIVRRGHTNQGLLVKKEMAGQYSDWLEDFTELMTDLHGVGFSGPGVPILEQFSANHTTYVVERYFQSLTFGEFLTRSGGALRWPAAKKLFMPLFTRLSHLHTKGLIHGGICLDNLLVDSSGRLWLGGFATRRLRTGDSDTPAELYPGYSAPEQYSINDFWGSWTDVYAMAAVLYRTLAGTCPPAANERTLGGALTPANQLDTSIPKNISDALTAAMNLDPEKRIRSVDDFTAALLESSDSNTAVFETSKVPVIEEEEVRRPTIRTIFKMGRISPGIGYFMAAASVTFILVGASLGYLMTNVFPDLMEDIQPAVQESSSPIVEEDLYEVPSLVGVFEGTVRQSDAYVRLFTMTFYEAFNEDYPVGVVFRQEPEAGAQLGLREEVVLYVSKGSDQVEMPNLEGGTEAFAINTLTNLDIRYTIEYVGEEDAPDVADNIVLSTDKSVGSKLRRFSDTVMLRIKNDQKTQTDDDDE